MLEESVMRSMSIQHQQYIKFYIIDELEKMSDDDHIVICTEIDNSSVGIIINAYNTKDEYIGEIITTIYNSLLNNFRLRMVASIGCWVNTPMDLGLSFNEAKRILKYRLFLPDNSVVLSRTLLKRELSVSKIPENLLDSFAKALNSGKFRDVEKCTKQLIDIAVKGDYSADHCTIQFTKVFYLLADYARNIQYEYLDELENTLFKPLRNIWNINELESLILNNAHKILNYAEKLNDNQNNKVILVLKNYISENLDKELSLNSLSNVVYLNPKYLSRLFKNMTGYNLTDYINKIRMERAVEFLKNTSMTIDEIATAVGYSNSAYFIKCFKKSYGFTPKHYRLMKFSTLEN